MHKADNGIMVPASSDVLRFHQKQPENKLDNKKPSARTKPRQASQPRIQKNLRVGTPLKTSAASARSPEDIPTDIKETRPKAAHAEAQHLSASGLTPQQETQVAGKPDAAPLLPPPSAAPATQQQIKGFVEKTSRFSKLLPAWCQKAQDALESAGSSLIQLPECQDFLAAFSGNSPKPTQAQFNKNLKIFGDVSAAFNFPSYYGNFNWNVFRMQLVEKGFQFQLLTAQMEYVIRQLTHEAHQIAAKASLLADKFNFQAEQDAAKRSAAETLTNLRSKGLESLGATLRNPDPTLTGQDLSMYRALTATQHAAPVNDLMREDFISKLMGDPVDVEPVEGHVPPEHQEQVNKLRSMYDWRVDPVQVRDDPGGPIFSRTWDRKKIQRFFLTKTELNNLPEAVRTRYEEQYRHFKNLYANDFPGAMGLLIGERDRIAHAQYHMRQHAQDFQEQSEACSRRRAILPDDASHHEERDQLAQRSQALKQESDRLWGRAQNAQPIINNLNTEIQMYEDSIHHIAGKVAPDQEGFYILVRNRGEAAHSYQRCQDELAALEAKCTIHLSRADARGAPPNPQELDQEDAWRKRTLLQTIDLLGNRMVLVDRYVLGPYADAKGDSPLRHQPAHGPHAPVLHDNRAFRFRSGQMVNGQGENFYTSLKDKLRNPALPAQDHMQAQDTLAAFERTAPVHVWAACVLEDAYRQDTGLSGRSPLVRALDRFNRGVAPAVGDEDERVLHKALANITAEHMLSHVASLGDINSDARQARLNFWKAQRIRDQQPVGRRYDMPLVGSLALNLKRRWQLPTAPRMQPTPPIAALPHEHRFKGLAELDYNDPEQVRAFRDSQVQAGNAVFGMGHGYWDSWLDTFQNLAQVGKIFDTSALKGPAEYFSQVSAALISQSSQRVSDQSREHFMMVWNTIDQLREALMRTVHFRGNF